VLSVRVKVRASQSRVLGVREGRLEIAVAAPPVDGAANRELVRAVADALGVAPGRIRVVRGKSGRLKELAIRGISEADVLARLAP
jgi:hypothetical protein